MPIIVDNNMDEEIINALRRKFPQKNLIKSFPLTSISAPLNTHPDIQIHFLNSNTAVCAPECYDYYAQFSKNIDNLLCGTLVPENTYPLDVAYNVARVGNYVISNIRYTEPKIIEYYQSHGYTILNTKQGYAKCNLCIADRYAVITEDANIYSVLSDVLNIECLAVEKGNVLLPGYPYGFIGGASGLVEDTLVFTGKITDNRIIKFLEEREIDFFEAGNGQLKDFGSIIFGGDDH